MLAAGAKRLSCAQAAWSGAGGSHQLRLAQRFAALLSQKQSTRPVQRLYLTVAVVSRRAPKAPSARLHCRPRLHSPPAVQQLRLWLHDETR